jgi:CBS domain-containing protein
VNEQGSELNAGVIEIARFLAQRPPFDALAPDELAAVAGRAAIEFHPAGTVILSQDGGPVTFLRIIHSGAVDITHDGRLLDLLAPGDAFGHAAMLSGLPPGFQARAGEDTLCYRVPVEVARPLLDQARRRELRSGLTSPAAQPVVKVIRSPTVTCRASESIGIVAQRMTAAGSNAAVVELDDGMIGIITDRDLRTRVLAAGRSGGVRADTAMTAPAWTVTPDRLAGEVLHEMLERGLRHAPVVSADGRLVGVIEDADLVAAQPRSWFGMRREIDRATGLEALAGAAARLPALMLELHHSSIPALELPLALSAVVDALARRALDLVSADGDGVPDGLVWVAVGSQARRELTPGSTRRGALIYGAGAAPDVAWLVRAGQALRVCGIAPEVVAHDAADWTALAAHATGDAPPGQTDELALSVLADRRVLWGRPVQALPTPGNAERIVTLLAHRAFATALPTGFDVDAVLTPEGRHDRLDIREAAIVPIAAIARWAAALVALGSPGEPEADREGALGRGGSTPQRLSAAARAGILRDDQAQTLSEAFGLALELRIVHQLELIELGRKPDDLLDPALMSPLTRSHLRDVFRAVETVARELRP